MDLEANKTVIRRIDAEGFNHGDTSVFDTLYAKDFRHHSKTIHDVSAGAEGERESMLRFRQAIPDVRFQIEDVIAEGVQVVVRLRVTGNPVAEFPPIQPGAPIEFRAVAVFRLSGGRVTEEWFYRDVAG